MKRSKIFFRLSGQLMKQYLPLVFLQAIVFGAISIFFMLLKPLLLQSVFSALEHQDVTETMKVCLQYSLALIVAFFFAYLNNVVLDANCFQAMHGVICNIFMKWHEVRGENKEDGTVFQNITAGAQALITAPINIMQFLGSIGALLFLLVFSSTAFKILPFILTVLFFILMILNLYEVRMMQKRENREQEALGAAEEKVHSFFREMSFLQQHGAFDLERTEYEKARWSAWQAQLHKVKGHSTVELITESLIGISFVALFLSVIFGADAKVVTMANMAVAVSLLQSISSNVAQLLTRIKSTMQVLVPLERVSDLLEDKNSQVATDFQKTPVMIHAANSIIALKEGEHIAIIGHNGSGKTTLLSKIAGIAYQSQGAQAEVYGNNAELLSYENRRACISIAPKDEMLFDSSAAENVRMNADEREEKQLECMVSEVDAQNFIQLNASQLSGGQAKRVNLLRACIHSARIIIADEPTASLDEENAKKAMKLLHQHAQDKLLIVVTHDPESLKEFDRIIFMDHLEPVFVGSYEELLKSAEFEKWQNDAQAVL